MKVVKRRFKCRSEGSYVIVGIVVIRGDGEVEVKQRISMWYVAGANRCNTQTKHKCDI